MAAYASASRIEQAGTKLLASKDGSSVLEWVDVNKEVVRRFGVTSDGNFVDETPVDLRKNAQGSHPPGKEGRWRPNG